MDTQETEIAFLTEQEARDSALKTSTNRNKSLYVILTGDKYFVSASNKLQPYEIVLACFLKGQLVF